MTRRQFVVVVGVSAAAGARAVVAQQPPGIPGATMSGDGYVPVRRPPKGADAPRMSALERDAVERMIACPCPCTLDVFTCRTSMPCGFAPRMHADVVSLAEGGYSASEILAEFEGAYGEHVRMAPRAEGFNWVGWLAPFAAIGTGGVVLAALIRRWGRRAAASRAAAPLPVEASDDEMKRLEAAIRNDSQ